jgi:hypothetical protein
LRNISEGELTGPDTPQHAMTGIFIADFIKDGMFLKTFQEIWDYTWTYYAQYPALALFHWPPMFYVFEGIYFLSVPISEPFARLLVFVFWVIAIVYFYRLMEALFDDNLAFLASVLFITNPVILKFARMLSLEIPSLSICIVAIYYFHTYMIRIDNRNAVLFSFFSGLALLIKQNSVFLLLFNLLYFIYCLLAKERINYKHILLCWVILGIMILPYYGAAVFIHGGTIAKDVFQGTALKESIFSLRSIAFYILALPKQVSFSAFIGLVLYFGLLFSQMTKVTRSSIFLLLWALSCYLTFTMVAQKDDRYIIYWIPALSGLAAAGFMEMLALVSSRWQKETKMMQILMVALILIIAVTSAIRFKHPVTKGYDEIACDLLSRLPAQQREIFFFDGKDHGFMTFSLRKNDPERRTFLFRSSKYLYATNIFSDYETWQVRTAKEEIVNFFNKYGIRYVILSFATESHLPAVQFLRELVQEDEDFILLKQFSVINWLYGEGKVALYSYRNAEPLTPGTELEIPMPTLGKTIKIQLP